MQKKAATTKTTRLLILKYLGLWNFSNANVVKNCKTFKQELRLYLTATEKLKKPNEVKNSIHTHNNCYPSINQYFLETKIMNIKTKIFITEKRLNIFSCIGKPCDPFYNDNLQIIALLYKGELCIELFIRNFPFRLKYYLILKKYI